MSKLKNYYQVLEIESFAATETIRTAFRKLARKYHPDLNPGDHAAEEKFKELNEAYDVLTDPQKRPFYDKSLQFLLEKPDFSAGVRAQPSAKKAKEKQEPGKPPFSDKQPASKDENKAPEPKGDRRKAEGSYENRSTAPTSSPGSSIPINELFESFIKKNVAPPKENKNQSVFSKAEEKQKRGEDVSVDTPIMAADAESGLVKTVHIQHNEICRKCAGTGRLQGVVCSVCMGGRTTMKLKKLDVRIPAGVKEGSKVRVSGEGGRGVNGGDNGDLYLHIRILPEVEKTPKTKPAAASELKIEGFHVYCELPLSIPQAIFGADLEIPTLTGAVKMTIPPLTSSGKVFRLKEMGVQNGKTKGDQFVTVQIILPDKLSDREKELYREIARIHNYFG